MSRLLVLLAAASLAGCARYKTSDQLRNEQRARDTALPDALVVQPCEIPSFDDFGWRLDSLGPIPFRVPSRVRSLGSATSGMKEFRHRSGYLVLWFAADAGQLYQQAFFGNTGWRETNCAIAGRMADVAAPVHRSEFATAIWWREAALGVPLVAVVRARTLDDYRFLRAVLFTLQLP